MINTQQQNLNFGWNGVTHKAITQKAVNKLNRLNRNKKGVYHFNTEKIIQASILPDRDPELRKTLHIADIENPQKNDGYSSFAKFHHKAIKAFKQKKMSEFEKNLGIAAHYLQDILNPYHVGSKARRLGKIEARDHFVFENEAVHHQEQVMDNARSSHEDSGLDINDFIKQKMRNTKKIKKRLFEKTITKNSFNNSIHESLKNCYDVTFEYFSYVLTKI